MFTGIITDIGEIAEVKKKEQSSTISIITKYDINSIDIGASISCNGCCLTVIEKSPNLIAFDASPETLAKTNLGNLNIGDRINLERAMKLSDEIGGHLVSGHVDCLAEVSEINITEGNWQVKFKAPKEFAKYIITKGSIVINGVSLTINNVINNVENEIFEVNIIPHTLEQTNLKELKVGSMVNMEIDLIARYLEKLSK